MLRVSKQWPVRAFGPFTLSRRYDTMANFNPAPAWSDFDPVPMVATLEEIEIADELRRGLELKYFGKVTFAVREHSAGDVHAADGDDA
jgi:hypothetical protein